MNTLSETPRKIPIGMDGNERLQNQFESQLKV
jgi:hypothetical protein